MADISYHTQHSSQYHPLPSSDMAYHHPSANGQHATHLPNSSSSAGSNPSSPSEGHSPLQTTPKADTPQGQQPPSGTPKAEGKQQATFLTKLYHLLERPENHHMIRWDPAGEHIIVEKPEQLAIHVLPSVYRQSRFASFSRQLNIYGFMRKVNLRNVDPAIDDPDASTWSHPTLNRHSPPDVVANFKRRVPPRIPKSKKRPESDAQSNLPPRTAVGLAPMPPTMSAAGMPPMSSSPFVRGGRQRALTAPGSFTPLSQGGAVGWGTSYPRSLPPLTVPSESHAVYGHGGAYSQSSHSVHQLSPSEETTGSFGSMHPPYPAPAQRDMMMHPGQSQGYPYQDGSHQWGAAFQPPASSHSGSLSSLLNPSSNGYSSSRPSINTYPSFSTPSNPSPASVSPDSRPNTGYSVSSMQGYDDKSTYGHEYSRPGSSHHRPLSPNGGSRPSSSHQSSYPPTGGLSVRRPRRHSQAMSPYPSPYAHDPDQRPSTSPHPNDEAHLSRVRMASAADSYSFNPAQGDFAYSAAPLNGSVDSLGGNTGSLGGAGAWDGSRSVRPSTSASSLSAASHASSSQQARTPPASADGYGGPTETDISRWR